MKCPGNTTPFASGKQTYTRNGDKTLRQTIRIIPKNLAEYNLEHSATHYDNYKITQSRRNYEFFEDGRFFIRGQRLPKNATLLCLIFL